MNTKRNERLDWIDGLRAVACMSVILCHSSIAMPASWQVFSICPWATTYSLTFTNFYDYVGYAGVNLFLVLSGFCLYWPLTKGTLEPSYAAFLWRRFKRLAPACYVACILAALFSLYHHPWQQAFTLRWLAVHALFLQTEIPTYRNQILGQTWSLALEWQCYILFPLFVVAMRKFGVRPIVFATLVLNAVYRHWMFREIAFVGEQGLGFSLISNGAGRCSEFVIGMACASLIRQWNTTGVCPLKWTDAAYLPCMATSLFWTLTHIWDYNGVSRFTTFSDEAWGILFGGVLLLASQHRFGIRRYLSLRPLVWFGTISYSVYLTHGHVILFVEKVLHMNKWGDIGIMLGQFLVLIPVCALAGYLFYLPFEKPFLGVKSQSKALPRVSPEPSHEATQDALLPLAS